ncbi:hypothetical protein HETIRDRAFT_412047, partial [Heterobasidion irregulare TC 32-1]
MGHGYPRAQKNTTRAQDAAQRSETQCAPRETGQLISTGWETADKLGFGLRAIPEFL